MTGISVAGYFRVSSEEQVSRQTIQNQLDFYRKYLDLHGLQDAGVYPDDGVSGTIPLEERPQGARLLADAKAKLFGKVLVYRLDRIGRDPRVILNAVHELQQAGVSIKSMTEPFETGTVYGEFMMSILAGVAGLERGVFLERSALGTARAARAGKWLGGIVPYGYRVDGEGFLEISEAPLEGVAMTEAGLVRFVYACLAERGWSTIKVADHLNALGVPTSYGKDGRLIKRGQRKVRTAGIWRPGRVRNMVVNPTYRGEHFYGKRTAKKRELIPREVPPIVDCYTWNKAQAVLHENLIEATRNAKRRYLLRGLVVCGTCGLRYGGTSYKGPGGKLKAYYVCGGKTAYRGPLQGKCTNRNVPAEWLEKAVWGDVRRFIEHPGEALERLRESLAGGQVGMFDMAGEKDHIEAALSRQDIERQRVMTLYRKGLVGIADVERQLRDLDHEKTALESTLAALLAEERGQEDQADSLASAQVLLESLRESVAGDVPWEKRRELVKLLVKEITVSPPADGGRKAVVEATYLFSQMAYRTGIRAETNLGASHSEGS